MARTFDPFREVDRWFSEARTPANVGMPMDLYRSGDNYVARIDLPGVDPSTIDIDIEDRTLTIRAERKVQVEDGECQWLVRERPTGTFARQLNLGPGVASDKISADYADGVVELTIPVAEEAKPRKVTVQHTNAHQSISADPEGDN